MYYKTEYAILKDENAEVLHGKYRRKFDMLSDNREANRLLYTLAKKMLYHRSGTKYEDMYWIDMNTWQVLCEITDSRENSRIVYRNSIIKAIQKSDSILTMHSHPVGYPPSLEDFNSSFVHGYKLGIVIGHNGKIFLYSSGEIIAKEVYNFYFKRYFMKYKNEYLSQIATLEKLSQLYNIMFKEV